MSKEVDEHVNPFAAPLAAGGPPVSEALHAPSDAEIVRKEHLNHEASIKGIGSLYMLNGGLTTLCGVVVVGAGIVAMLAGGEEAAGALVMALIGLGYLGLGYGFWVLGKGFRQLKPWSRPWGIGLSAIGLLAIPIGTLISGYFLYLLASAKGKVIMTEEYRQVVAATPHIKYKTSVVVWILLGLLVAFFLLALFAAFTR